MQPGFKYKYCCFYAILLLSLFSCEDILDKNNTYVYKIKNNTTKPLEVHLRSLVLGDNAIRNSTIEAGATKSVWVDTGYDDDSYIDNREKYTTEVTGFRIKSLSKEGILINNNPNVSKRWNYEKTKNAKATYTLTVEETDF